VDGWSIFCETYHYTNPNESLFIPSPAGEDQDEEIKIKTYWNGYYTQKTGAPPLPSIAKTPKDLINDAKNY